MNSNGITARTLELILKRVAEQNAAKPGKGIQAFRDAIETALSERSGACDQPTD